MVLNNFEVLYAKKLVILVDLLTSLLIKTDTYDLLDSVKTVEWLELLLFQNVRPSLENIPKDIIPLLESCWAEDPKDRPEFMEVTDYLSNFYQELCSEETKPPPKVIETEDNDRNIKEEDSPCTTKQLAIDRPLEEKRVKRRKKSRSSGWFCFSCLAHWPNGMVSSVLGSLGLRGSLPRLGMHVGWLIGCSLSFCCIHRA